jgi:hypothetical protein
MLVRNFFGFKDLGDHLMYMSNAKDILHEHRAFPCEVFDISISSDTA